MVGGGDGTSGNGLRAYAGLDEVELRGVLDLVAGTDVVELHVRHESGYVTLRRETLARAGQELTPVAPGQAGSEGPLAITSPLVGIFHPAVGAGDSVAQGQPLGAIEALGMPTSVDAPQSGVVEEILAPDGSPVEYGQPLLVLRRAERGREG